LQSISSQTWMRLKCVVLFDSLSSAKMFSLG
jgi:hypothetical protein